MAKSTAQPKPYELLYEENGMSKYKLTKILGEKEFKNDFTGETLKLYEYDEADIIQGTTVSLEDNIKNNFEDYWKKAKEQTENKANFLRKMETYKAYESDGRMIEMIQQAGNQITSLMLEVLMLNSQK